MLTILICDICDHPASHLILGICYYCWREHEAGLRSADEQADAEQARVEREYEARQPIQSNQPV